MSFLLWILQILLALHTLIGAVWKFSNSEKVVPSLQAIPHPVWTAMSAIEILCSLALVLPMFNKSWTLLPPIAAVCIGSEMLFFSGLHLYSGSSERGPMIYWLVVSMICIFTAYGRWRQSRSH